MKFLIFGSGGVGGFFGAKLAKAGNDVRFVARGEHFKAMKQSGLSVKSTQGEFNVAPENIIENPADAGPADVILFCVKSFDTEPAAAQLDPTLTENSVIICLQNGIDNEVKIQRIIQRGNVYGGAAYISARIETAGRVMETGGLQRIVFGPMDGKTEQRSKQILDVFQKANINTALHPDITQELWRKFAFITSMGSMTALTRLTQGEIFASKETMDLVFEAMREVESVGRAKKVNIHALEPEKVIEGIKRFDPNTRSSMYYDLINQKPMEIEALNGTVVRLGAELNVATPIHRTIYAALLPHHLRHIQKQTMK